jgi:DNA-binding MarR family transcriptional regulator
MKIDNSIKLIGQVREKANDFLLNELKQIGIVDIATSHGDILSTLFKYKECTMTELSNSINKDRSTVTALINKLTKFGYVSSKKDPEDNRSTIIYLTEKGKELEPNFQKISEKLYEKEYQGITDEEKDIFNKILKKIYNNF